MLTDWLSSFHQERLIHARVEPIIVPLLPQEQMGFWHRRSTVDQITLLTQHTKDSFTAKKDGALFVDLTAAYDIVWHRDLTCKLLWLLPDRDMVHMIIELVGNRSFTLTTGNGQRSRLWRLKNGIPQVSVLEPLLSIIYISDLPTTVSRKHTYADDLAIMHADGEWQAVEGVLSKNMAIIGEYLQTWKLKLSTTKMVSAAFHLSNNDSRKHPTCWASLQWSHTVSSM